jgi:hypothetical protein
MMSLRNHDVHVELRFVKSVKTKKDVMMCCNLAVKTNSEDDAVTKSTKTVTAIPDVKFDSVRPMLLA